MTVFLVRHAHAGLRSADVHDRYRPLSDRGWARAEELASLFADEPVRAVWSSPATRCVQTVEYIAKSHGMDVTEDEAFWEASPMADAFAAIRGFLSVSPNGGPDGAEPGHLVVCSHGNLIPEMIDHLLVSRVPVKGRGCEKGSVWALEHQGVDWTRATYRPQLLR